jgi:hypothetical protein
MGSWSVSQNVEEKTHNLDIKTHKRLKHTKKNNKSIFKKNLLAFSILEFCELSNSLIRSTEPLKSKLEFKFILLRKTQLLMKI